MAEPRVPGSREPFELPCGEQVDASGIDLGVREFECDCGERHAVVTDVNPLTRFVPEFLAETLREAVGTDDEFEEFGTPHLMGLVLEEFPGEVAVYDASDDGRVGHALLWITGFDSRRLHEVVVELVIELMEHAMSHAGDDDAMAAFEERMLEFDVGEFVEQYRSERDRHAEDVPGYTDAREP